MGLFKSAKRAVKKITKPVARVLNKVVPNEIKPFLPYAAAVAPYLLPAGTAGAGLLGTMKGRAFLTGGLNLASQLAQEGNEEGDFSALSLGLAGLQGALTAPGAAETLRGMQVADTYNPELAQLGKPELVGEPLSFLDKARNVGLGTLEKAAVASEGIAGTLQDPFSASLGEFGKAAVVPFSQGSMDLGMATARQALRDYELELDAFNAQAGANQAASDADRRAAIIASMTRADFTQDIIDETLGQLGLKDGGIARLGFDNGGDVSFGGIKEAIKGVAENNMEEGVTQMYVSDSAGVIPLRDGDAVTGKTMDMMVSGFVEPYTKNDFRDPDGYERFMDVFSEFKETKMKKDEELNEEGMKDGGIMNAKRGLVDGPGGYAGERAGSLNNKIEGFSQKMLDEYLQGNIPEFKGESVSEYYSRPNFVDANAITKIIEMGGDYDDVRETLKIDISDERLDDILGYSDSKFYDNMKKGGLASFKDGGIMNLGGKEMDMRTGGFIPIGAKERADDVPARLSKNEFVMTADAVRAAGGGSVNKGAKRMYDLMHNLEARA